MVCAALLGAGGLLFCGLAAAAPVVTLTSPTAGETLGDPVVISATVIPATDVTSVQFWLDGHRLAEIPGQPEGVPYTMTWNPWTISTGNYTIRAVALYAGNQTAPSNEARISVFATPGQATVFAARPLPVVRARLGRMPGDYIWGGTPSSTAVGTGYLTYDRDPLAIHDLHWFERHHPDWLVYTCDRRPVRYFNPSLHVFDITNPEVREYQYRVFVRNHMKRGSNGLSIDNFLFRNYWGKCGVYRQGVWLQKYTGELDDPQYVEDALAWLTWMANRVHADGGLVAVNVVEPFHPDFDRAASQVDLVHVEGGGFINTYCAPAWTDDAWLLKFLAFRKIAVERGLAVQDETCDYMSQLTPELVSWDVANFFLLRGDRSYFSMTQSYAKRPLTEPDYDGPELYAPLGEPLGEPQQQGVIWTRPYQNGLVVVNPSSTAGGTLSLGANTFHDVRGREFTGEVTVPPATGLVLVSVTYKSGVFVAAGRIDGSLGAELITAPDGGGAPHVKIFKPNGTLLGTGFLAYPAGFTGGVRVAACDFDGDGRDEIVTGAGPGGGAHVRLFKVDTAGIPVAELASFLAYPLGFTGGVFVACGNVEGTAGTMNIVTGAGAGGSSHVRVLRYSPGAPDGGVVPVFELLAYGFFSGGVHVAAGDVDGSGRASVITGPGPGGGPHIRVLKAVGASLVSLGEFFAYDPGFTGGTWVAAGNVTGGAAAEVITGPGPGGGPHVRVFDGAGTEVAFPGFLAYPAGFTGGVRVAAGDLDGAGLQELVTVTGPGSGPHVLSFTAIGALTGTSFLAY